MTRPYSVGVADIEGLAAVSALPPKADIAERDRHVRFVPEAEVSNRSK
jgi:hypothetical protein